MSQNHSKSPRNVPKNLSGLLDLTSYPDIFPAWLIRPRAKTRQDCQQLRRYQQVMWSRLLDDLHRHTGTQTRASNECRRYLIPNNSLKYRRHVWPSKESVSYQIGSSCCRSHRELILLLVLWTPRRIEQWHSVGFSCPNEQVIFRLTGVAVDWIETLLPQTNSV